MIEMFNLSFVDGITNEKNFGASMVNPNLLALSVPYVGEVDTYHCKNIAWIWKV